VGPKDKKFFFITTIRGKVQALLYGLYGVLRERRKKLLTTLYYKRRKKGKKKTEGTLLTYLCK